jgi:hypothetical protein
MNKLKGNKMTEKKIKHECALAKLISANAGKALKLVEITQNGDDNIFLCPNLVIAIDASINKKSIVTYFTGEIFYVKASPEEINSELYKGK